MEAKLNIPGLKKVHSGNNVVKRMKDLGENRLILTAEVIRLQAEIKRLKTQAKRMAKIMRQANIGPTTG